MFNFNANNYLNNITQTPHEHYHDLIQATVDSQWNNTTLLDYIKEENIPFDGEYTKQEVWVDTISDVTVNTLKVIGNYINVTFKDGKRVITLNINVKAQEPDTEMLTKELEMILVSDDNSIISAG